MEYGWRGSLPQAPLKPGSNTAVQRMLQDQQGKEPNPQSFAARLESRRRAQFEWPPRPPSHIPGGVPLSARQYFSPSQPASTTGLKKVTWPPPLEDYELADGEQEPVYSQAAPATNGFASPSPQYAEQVSRSGRNVQPQTPPSQRRSASRDRSRRSPAWTPPPTIISLRQSPPIHQQPAPVVVSQPATARMQAPVQSAPQPGALQNGHAGFSRTNSSSVSPTPPGVAPKPTRVTAKNRGDLKWPPEVVEIIPETIAFEVPLAKQTEPVVKQSGVRARGDAKWPPQEYKTRADEENAQRVALAKGPVCRPRLPKRDYRSFFEQNQVNSMYPGYRAPPGTQHYVDETGVSEF